VDNSGEPVYKKWTPNEEEIKEANEVYIDASKKAVFKISPGKHSENYALVFTIVHQNPIDERNLHKYLFCFKIQNGILSETSITHDGISHVAKSMESPKNDYSKQLHYITNIFV